MKTKPIVLETIEFPSRLSGLAIEPKTKADQEKIGKHCIAWRKKIRRSASQRNETGQTIISGMGELHLEIIVDRMKREFNVDANIGRPQVAYRETIREGDAEGKYIKQSGGHGQYGHCKIELHLNPSSSHVYERDVHGRSRRSRKGSRGRRF